jgi:ArsR family metal-binding transcriptional regulator
MRFGTGLRKSVMKKCKVNDAGSEKDGFMLIEDYKVEVTTPACDLESPIYMANVTLPVDISEALPYVNAKVDKAEYLPSVPAMVFRLDGRKYALRAREIAISNVSDKPEGAKLARGIVDKINAIWEDRDSIEPSYGSWSKPKVLDILRLLPQTNCKDCGVPTCMAFATKLSEDKASLEECPRMGEGESAEKLASLRELGL